MVVGLIVRLEFLPKKVLNCHIISTTKAVLQNGGKISFVTFTVSSISPTEEQNIFSSISIGHVISIQGHAKTPKAEHIFACVRNVKILNPLYVPAPVFEPSTTCFFSYTSIKKRKNKVVPAIVLVVKLVCPKNRCVVHCVDAHNRYFKLTLLSDRHIIKHLDIILLSNIKVNLTSRTVQALSASNIEVNTPVADKRINAIRKKLEMQRVTIKSVDEIDKIKKDCSIILDGRIFRISREKNSIHIFNSKGGISVTLDEEAYMHLTSRIMNMHALKSKEELYGSLEFCKVRLTADIVFLDNTSSIHNVTITPIL
ncbi:hypothetical protein NEAUS06_1748 [Nematocida ausubeli]|nr:hypothetical protein NEAUS06_1748 [Nematocida ausubeli]